MSEPERASFLGALPEALFLALVTVGAYSVSFCYEAGYCINYDCGIRHQSYT